MYSIEWHTTPMSRDRTAEYRIREGQSGVFGKARTRLSHRGLFQPSILKDRRERSAATVRERIRPALAIVRDESPNGHGLHRPCRDADRDGVDADPSAEQDQSVALGKSASFI
jgi:hypothetical protein